MVMGDSGVRVVRLRSSMMRMVMMVMMWINYLRLIHHATLIGRRCRELASLELEMLLLESCRLFASLRRPTLLATCAALGCGLPIWPTR